MRLMILLAAALCLTACVSSPGRDCSSVPQEVNQSGKDNQAAQSNARSGQETTGEQLMQDTVPAKPGTTWGRGEGDVTASNDWEENRSQSGAPVTSQGLLFPANSSAKNVKVGGVHPLIQALQSQLFDTNRRLDVAVATGNTVLADSLRQDVKDLLDKMHTASVDTAQTVNNAYHFEGAIISQGVSSSSGANARPGTAKTEEGGTSTGPSVPEILKSSGVLPVAPAGDSLPKPSGGGTD